MVLTHYSIPKLLIMWNMMSLLKFGVAWNHTEIKYPDVEGDRQQARLLGVSVALGVCALFALSLCISCIYYKLKAHRRPKFEKYHLIKNEDPHVTIKEQPHVIIKESFSNNKNKQASRSEQQSEGNVNVESVTQVTKF